jgi:hypothetical protein
MVEAVEAILAVGLRHDCHPPAPVVLRTQESMIAAQNDSVERALWAALRSLEQRGTLIDKLAATARRRGHETVRETLQSAPTRHRRRPSNAPRSEHQRRHPRTGGTGRLLTEYREFGS